MQLQWALDALEVSVRLSRVAQVLHFACHQDSQSSDALEEAGVQFGEHVFWHFASTRTAKPYSRLVTY